MDKEYFTDLTNDLYRLTLLFPKKEPLRYKIRELADNILANLSILLEGTEKRESEIILELKGDLAPLNNFFDVAKKQNWVAEENIDNVQDRYRAIKEEIDKFKSEEVEEEKELPVSLIDLKGREKEIVELLKEKGRAQVSDIISLFPKINKRTIRRDFDSLTRKGIVKRVGKANLTFYQLVSGEIS